MRHSAIFAALLVVFCVGSEAHAQLKKVQVIFHTTNDDRDHDTRIKVEVRHGGEELGVGDNLAREIHFDDWTFHTVWLIRKNLQRNI